ncbi:conserved protein of unknown function (plasmid) [Rhodovastum atsumiense]|uniref:Uncharacterized protein n=1 Tax=Rhodovastum atsumiense TaxID=504468 RepID=A0A5M6ITJ1_9PROT|nr:hypothetical protein [Rhodovastum atsumiense]KAA5611636.1 hypothetical protein F1189_13835 [Rhodovastum atsumiense]CAH2606270.1 conserved protein of unknown function [Rhodovastum atsumiense]
MTANAQQQIGRLALRVEGEFWNAYYARPNTMDGAILLGSIRMAIVTASQARKLAFTEIMKGAVAAHIEEISGVRPTWRDPMPGPESERSGHA